VSGLRVVWRFARRGAVLTRRQAALIVTLIALPIVAFSGALLIVQSSVPNEAELRVAIFGHAQSKLQQISAPDPSLHQTPAGSAVWDRAVDQNGVPTQVDEDAPWATPASALPSSTPVLRLTDSSATVETATGVADLPVTLGPAWDPALHGRFEITAGHAPRGSDEIAVSEPTLARLGVGLGDTVHLDRPLDAEFTVTAVLADARGARSVQELFLPDGAFDGTSAAPQPSAYTYYLPDLDLDAAQLLALNHAGFVGTSRSLADLTSLRSWSQGAGATESVYLMLVGVGVLFLTFEVLLLAGSAFFIGARARQRVLAIVASTGANRSTLIGIVTSTGAALGLIAGVIGVAAGIGAGSATMALTDDGSFDRYPGYHLSWPTHLAIVAFALVVGFAASLIPALAVSRLDVVAALRGATRPAKPRPRRPVVGIALTVVGAACTLGFGLLLAGVNSGWWDGPPGDPSWIAAHTTPLTRALSYAFAGALIVMQIGLIVAAGLVLRAAGSALRRLGVSARLASRDLERNRSRAVPAIASIMVTSSLAVLAMGFMASQTATDAKSYMWTTEPDQALAYAGGSAGLTPQQQQDLQSVVARTLPVTGSFAVISGVQPPTQGDAAAPGSTSALFASPFPSSANICPTHDAQGELVYTPTTRDWRCSDAWVRFSWGADGVPTIVVGDESTLAAILGHTPSAAARDALADGGAVSLHRAFLNGDHVSIGWWPASSVDRLQNVDVLAHPERSATVPAVLESTAHSIGFGVVLSPAAAARLGITASAQSVLAQLSRAPTDAEQDAIRAAADALAPGPLTGQSVYFGVRTENGPSDGTGPYLWAALAASSLIAIASAVVAITLARQDGARDDTVFSAVGASPSVRRRLAFWQAVILVGSGALLGAGTAVLAVYAVEGFNQTQVFAMPWLQAAMATIGVTLVIALGAWLFAGRLRERSLRDAIG
jgi:hypothetical protein